MLASAIPKVPMPVLVLVLAEPPHAVEASIKPTAAPAASSSSAGAPAGPAEPTDRNPVPLPNNPAPTYPELARRKGFEGTVVLRVAVSAAGQPTAIALATSSGHDLLDDRAIETVWHWRFLPALAKGQAVAGLVLLPITFELRA